MLVNDGTYAQDELQKVLKTFCEYNTAMFHRFPDTKSAGGHFLQNQPGDYMLNVPGKSILIECKSSTVETKVHVLAHKGKVGKNQIAQHRKWLRSGHPSLYLYYNFKRKLFSWHNGLDVINKNSSTIWEGELRDLGSSIPVVVELIKRK